MSSCSQRSFLIGGIILVAVVVLYYMMQSGCCAGHKSEAQTESAQMNTSLDVENAQPIENLEDAEVIAEAVSEAA